MCSLDGVEATAIDHKDGTLLTLTNWADAPAKGVVVKLRVPFAPKSVRSVHGQKVIDATYANGVLTFAMDVADADYVMVMR